MTKLIEKRRELNKAAKDYQDIATKAEISAEDRAKMEAAWKDYEARAKEIEVLEEEEKRLKIITDLDKENFDKEARAASAAAAGGGTGAAAGGTPAKPDVSRFLRRTLAGSMTAEERAACYTETEKKLMTEQRAGFGTGAANVGAVTVPTEVFNRIIIAMRPFGWFFGENAHDTTGPDGGSLKDGAAEIIRTNGGYPLNIPLLNDTGVNASIVADGGAIAADASTPFSMITLNAYKFVSLQLAISYELLEDAAVDVDALIYLMIAQRMGRGMNYYTTLGTGTAQPKGIITAAPSFQSTITGKVGQPQFADVMKLMYSVNASYRNAPAAAFMACDLGIQGMLSLVDSNNRPLINFNGFSESFAQRILGYPIISNWDIAAPAVSAKSLVFGDLSQYKVRFANDLMVIVQREALATSGQIGFVALWRMDANLADAGTHPVYVFQGAAT